MTPCPEEYSDVCLPFGELPDGRIVDVSAVDSGFDCNCRCPSCHARLVAKKGKSGRQRHHFAHEADGGCRGGLETSIHKMAKQIINDEMRIYLPAVVAQFDGKNRQKYPERWSRLDAVALEVWQNGIRLDIIASRGGRQLLIEILFSHPCSAEKIATIRDRGTAAVEIDIRSFRRGQISDERLRESVLAVAPRCWLFHPHQAQIDAELRKDIEAEAAAEELRRAALGPDYQPGGLLYELNQMMKSTDKILRGGQKQLAEMERASAARRARRRNWNAKLQRMTADLNNR